MITMAMVAEETKKKTRNNKKMVKRINGGYCSMEKYLIIDLALCTKAKEFQWRYPDEF